MEENIVKFAQALLTEPEFSVLSAAIERGLHGKEDLWHAVEFLNLVGLEPDSDNVENLMRHIEQLHEIKKKFLKDVETKGLYAVAYSLATQKASYDMTFAEMIDALREHEYNNEAICAFVGDYESNLNEWADCGTEYIHMDY